MEDKKMLNEKELEEISGGRKIENYGVELCLYCADCSCMLFHGWPEDVIDIMEEKRHYFEQNHCCCPGKIPKILNGIYYGQTCQEA